MTYELHLTTIHCIGRLNHVVGVVETEAEAREWVEGSRDSARRHARIPQEDPIVWCPVKHCHMKRQKTLRSYEISSLAASEGHENVWG
jgi:hypothetical protein